MTHFIQILLRLLRIIQDIPEILCFDQIVLLVFCKHRRQLGFAAIEESPFLTNQYRLFQTDIVLLK